MLLNLNRIADKSNLSETVYIMSDRKQNVNTRVTRFLPIFSRCGHTVEKSVQEECEKRKVCLSKATNKTQITFSKSSKNKFK